MKILLASASPRRKELIKLISDNVRIVPADCDETVSEKLSAEETVLYLSKIKGKAVFGEINDDEVIVSADTVVALDGKILGKPHSKEQAADMLKTLSGRIHRVYTGVTLMNKEKSISFSECTEVEFFKLSDEDIEKYIKTGEPFDKAGAYGIQGVGSLLVKKINGDYFNVVGLPVAHLYRELAEFYF